MLVNEAVEKMIAFGLDADRYDAANRLRCVSAQWTTWTWRSGRHHVTLDVSGRGKSLVVKMVLKTGKMSADAAAAFATLTGRVTKLAQEIEALS